MTEQEPAAIYTRVSSPKQTDNFSISEQVAMCLAECDRLNLSVAEEYIIRDTFTGSTLERPMFEKLKSLPVKYIVVIKQDRLSRADELDTMQCIRELNAAGKTVHAVDAGIMETQGFPGMITFMKAVIARVGREDIKANTARGRIGRAKDGKVQTGPTPPYGYDADRENGTFTKNSDEARIVAMIFDWYTGSEKLGIVKIANRLNDDGVPTKDVVGGSRKPGNKRNVWRPSGISRILHREVYASGVWHFNKTERIRAKNKKTGAPGKTRQRDKSEWIPAPVPTIVDQETWDAAQVQARRNAGNSSRNTQSEGLMRGRMRCAVCGMAFACHTCKPGATAGDFRYRCGGDLKRNAPDGKTKTCHITPPRDVIDKEVWRLVSEALKNPERQIAYQRSQSAKIAEKMLPNIQYREECLRKVAEIDDEIELLLPLYLKRKITGDRFDAQQGRLSHERQKYVDKAAELDAIIELANSEAVDESVLRRFAKENGPKIDKMDYAARLAMIQSLDIRATLTYRGPGDFDIDLTGRIAFGFPIL